MLVTQATKFDIHIDPELSQWDSMMCAAQGELFGEEISSWRSDSRQSLGLPKSSPIIVVGHQPEFFHPGILAKFIAGDLVAKRIEGKLVHLVVDHHVGSFDTIEFPEDLGDKLVVRELQLATLEHDIAMKDQHRVTPVIGAEPFTDAIYNAKGDNAAMQFAGATDVLMAQWAEVDHLIGSSELLQTRFGLHIVDEMHQNPDQCREMYNQAISNHPGCGISMLESDELPVWYGPHNARHGTLADGVHPRALLVTLLARVILGDLFVHGTGGVLYDRIMEQWIADWLGITPCPATLATATLRLPLQQQTIEDARKQYFSPEGELQTRDQYLASIERAPYKSSTKSEQFKAMHDWLASLNVRPDQTHYRVAQRVASRRDWAFPLYPVEMLDQLRDAIKRS